MGMHWEDWEGGELGGDSWITRKIRGAGGMDEWMKTWMDGSMYMYV
jgi:hypothetical protein